MKKLKIILLIIPLVLGMFINFSFAENSSTKINLSDSEITVNGEKISTNSGERVYLSSKTDNGGTSSEAKEANIEIDNIITITAAGTYEFSGTLKNGQIAVNANSVNGEVKIILNNANITCKNAPAIMVYSKSIENENCKVIISSAQNSVNTITGGKIKVSVEGWSDQSELQYYVDKGYNEEREYYERYKYDGAISSDTSLTFEGEGTINVVSTKKEGIEVKMNVTLNSGIVNIQALDDCINACTDKKSVITINGGTVIANVSNDAEEGDAIDSNGYLYVNGGTVYAFAHPGADNGLDSDLGTYINGGTVFSVGGMYEAFQTQNNTTFIQMQFSSEVNEGEDIAVTDENGNAIFAYKADRKISTICYSSDKLESGKTYTVYTGKGVTGTTDNNNIYTNIEKVDLNSMTKQENTSKGMGMPGEMQRGQFEPQEQQITEQEDTTNYTGIAIGCFAVALILIAIGIVFMKKQK